MKPSFRAFSLRSFTNRFKCGSTFAAHRLAGLPGGAALGRVLRLGEDAADLVVGQLPAAHHRPEDVERLFHHVRLGQHLLQQRGLDLLGQVFQVEDFDLPPQERIGRRMLVDGLQLGEGRRIGERKVQLRLNRLLLAEVFVRAGDVGGPIAAAGLDLQRTHNALVALDEAAGPGVLLAAVGSAAARPAAIATRHRRSRQTPAMTATWILPLGVRGNEPVA